MNSTYGLLETRLYLPMSNTKAPKNVVSPQVSLWTSHAPEGLLIWLSFIPLYPTHCCSSSARNTSAMPLLCSSAFSFLGVWVLCPVSLYSGLPQTPIWRCRQGPVLLYMPIFDLIISYQVLCQNRFYFFAVYVFEMECSTTMTDCFVRVLFLCAFSPLIELFALKIELHKRKKK